MIDEGGPEEPICITAKRVDGVELEVEILKCAMEMFHSHRHRGKHRPTYDTGGPLFCAERLHRRHPDRVRIDDSGNMTFMWPQDAKRQGGVAP